MNVKVTFREMIMVVLSLLFFFQQYIEMYLFPIFSYYDEVLSIFFFSYFCLIGVKRGFKKLELKQICYMVLLVALGLFSNFYYRVQTGTIPVMLDVLAVLKIFMLFLGVKCYYSFFNYYEKRGVVVCISTVIKIFVTITFVCAIINLIIPTGMGSDVRYGIRSFSFINLNAGTFSYMFYFIMFILTLDCLYCKNKKYNFIFIIFALLSWIATLRTRAFIFSISYLVLYFAFVIRGNSFKFKPIYFLIIIGVVFYVGFDQYQYYFTENETARAQFLQYSFVNFKDYFPFGSGFGTYGTSVAFDYYSPLYYKYGFDQVHGLVPGVGGFESDTFWPAIIGQFGLINGVLYCIILFLMLKSIVMNSKNNVLTLFSSIFIIFCLLISSLATSTFFHPITLSLIFIVPCGFNINDKRCF